MSAEPTMSLPVPGVSVVIIFLNARPFLTEAIDSVIRQTYSDWEIILVDDGSSDGSTELAQQYAAAQPHCIRYVAHPEHANLGMSASRNSGLREARGRYVAFLDADDVYLPERLARHVHILDKFVGVDMVQSDLIFWYSWQSASQRPCDDQVRPFLASSDRILAPPQGLLTVLAAPFFSAGICNITVRREVALDLGGFETGFRAMYEDQVFVSKIYLEKAVYVLQDYLAKYRRHPDSWVRRMKTSGQFVDGMANAATQEFHDWLIAYVKTRGVQHALLQPMLADFTTRPTRRSTAALRAIGAPALTVFKRLLLALMPRSAYRRVLQWNWERQTTQSLRGYQRLCKRMEKLAFDSCSRTPERP